jgi:CheY-like chemotaxis protein
MTPARPRILIVDDNVDTRALFDMYLGMDGFDVQTAKDGLEAVESVIARRPDLIVMDLDMPKMNGWDAIARLQAEPGTAAIPIVVLTGHDFKQYLKTAALVTGARAFLMKPCLPERLAYEIRTLLRDSFEASSARPPRTVSAD